MSWDQALEAARDLWSQAREGTLSGACVLSGEESYLVHRTAAEVLRILCPQGSGDLSLTRLSAPEVQLGDLVGALGSRGLFGGPGVVHLRALKPGRGGAGGLAGELGRWLRERGDWPRGAPMLLVEVDGKLRAKHPLRKAASVEIEFPALKTYDLGSTRKDSAYPWVVGYLRRREKEIAADAFGVLRRRTANSLWSLAGELDKLSAFVGDRRRIEASDVRDLVARSWEDQIFDLIEAVAAREPDRALILLGRLMDGGTRDTEVLRLLTRQIRLLLQGRCALERGELKGYQPGMRYYAFRRIQPELVEGLGPGGRVQGGLAGLHPFPLHRTLEQCGAFQPAELLDALEALLRLERALKSGVGQSRRNLEMFILHLAAGCPGEFQSHDDPLG